MLSELQNNYNEEEINNNKENENFNEDDNVLISDNSLNEDILDTSKNIKVFCRFRPPNEKELSHSTNNSLILLSPQKLIFTQEKNLEIKKEFTFDGLFDINTTKEAFYLKTSKPIISKFLLGYNGSIIFFGETGSGKTYTLREIIPLMTSQIFDYINESDIDDELFKIELSSFEINKEQINDMVDLTNKNLNLIQDEIANIKSVGISSIEQMNSVLNDIMYLRAQKEENNQEEKSHFIIRVTLYHYLKRKNCLLFSKLFLVDIEGSERLNKNKSLIALNNIVNNLISLQKNNNYIPYRDSKLTQIIHDSFGGNCYTSLILTCSKHELSSLETRNTLIFGSKAKNIVNNPFINIQQEINKKHSNDILQEISEEDENIQESINIHDSEKFLKIQINQLKEIINQDKIYIEQLNERVEVLELEKKNLMEEFERLIKAKNEENKKETINSEYIENNINEFHTILNEKEINENKMKEEINKLKLIIEKNNIKITESDNQMQILKELINCLEQASNQIQTKDKKIEELLSILDNNKKDEIIKNITEEKNSLISKKTEYDKRLSSMTKLVNKIKEELDKKNQIIINISKEKDIVLNQNNILNNKIQSLENRINNLTKEKKNLEEKNNKIKQEFKEQFNELTKESELKINELKNEFDIKNNISIELHNLKLKYQNIKKEIEIKKELIEKQNKDNKILKKEITELKNKNVLIKEENDKEIEQLKKEKNVLEEKIIIYENESKEIDSNKALINKLKQENISLNNIIIDLKSKNEKEENTTKNYFKKLSNLEQQLESKNKIINDYKTKYENILKENTINKNYIKELEENNKTEKLEMLNIKQEYNKEIEKYKNILIQKDIEINELNEQIINDKIGLEEILSLQKEIS